MYVTPLAEKRNFLNNPAKFQESQTKIKGSIDGTSSHQKFKKSLLYYI